jgi:hypothetical protein
MHGTYHGHFPISTRTWGPATSFHLGGKRKLFWLYPFRITATNATARNVTASRAVTTAAPRIHLILPCCLAQPWQRRIHCICIIFSCDCCWGTTYNSDDNPSNIKGICSRFTYNSEQPATAHLYATTYSYKTRHVFLLYELSCFSLPVMSGTRALSQFRVAKLTRIEKFEAPGDPTKRCASPVRGR